MPVSSAETTLSRGHALPRSVVGFEKIERYWDPLAEISTAKILPGQFYVTREDEQIVTVLGSCVSACIRDASAGVGGMNHFMLPKGSEGEKAGARYGIFAMESLMNELFKLGASKQRLEIKLVGGGRIGSSQTDVGRWNIDFVKEFLDHEQLKSVGEDLGGRNPRKVVYLPRLGKVRVLRIEELPNDTLHRRERSYERRLEEDRRKGAAVEIFESMEGRFDSTKNVRRERSRG